MTTKKARGWHGNPDGHKRTGSLGGKATAKAHGTDFYARIGSTGGKISGGNFKNNRALARRAGKKGGSVKAKKGYHRELFVNM